MWQLDYKESWAPKNWCFWTVVLEKTLESPLDCKEIRSVNPKGNQPWIFIENTDAEAEAEAPILWATGAKSWLIGKDPDAGKDWEQEKGMTENEMVRQHRWLSGYGSKQTLGDSEGHGILACCSPWGAKSQIQLSNWTTTKMSAWGSLSLRTRLIAMQITMTQLGRCLDWVMCPCQAGKRSYGQAHLCRLLHR